MCICFLPLLFVDLSYINLKGVGDFFLLFFFSKLNNLIPAKLTLEKIMPLNFAIFATLKSYRLWATALALLIELLL